MFSQVPVARASILWLIGEYCERVPKIAPDVLRKTAKTFTNEDDLVKLQILNLGTKLYLTNSKQVSLNSEVYVFRVRVGFIQSVDTSGDCFCISNQNWSILFYEEKQNISFSTSLTD